METIPDKWSVGTFSNQNIEGLARINTGLEAYIGNAQYPFRIGISAPLESFDTVDFYDFEDFIFDTYQKDNTSIVCAVLTSDTFRELVLYTSDKEVLKSTLPLLKKAFPTIQITSYFEEDKSWELYSNLLRKS